MAASPIRISVCKHSKAYLARESIDDDSSKSSVKRCDFRYPADMKGELLCLTLLLRLLASQGECLERGGCADAYSKPARTEEV
jgi:hypothetical protein